MIGSGYSAAANHHSSSSSNLSPLATPFIRPLPSTAPPLHQPPQYSLPPPAGFSSPTPPPSSGHLRPQKVTAGDIAEPYYPRHYPNSSQAAAAAAALAMGGCFMHPSGYNDGDDGSWSGSGSYDEELGLGNGIYPAAPPPSSMNSSWMYKAPNLPRGVAAEGHVIYNDDSHGTWHKMHHSSIAGKVHQGLENLERLQDKQKATYEPDFSSSYSIYAAAVPSASTSLEGMSYSDLPRSDSGTKTYSSFGSNHNQFIVQPDSCFANPLAFYPASSYPTYSHLHPPSNARANLRTGQTLRTAYPIVHNMSPVTVDEAADSSGKEKESKINKNSVSEGTYAAKYREDHGFKKGVSASENFGEGLFSTEKTSGRSSMDVSAELNSKLKSKGLAITLAPATNGSSEPDHSIKSSEALDQLNLAVDSPCWKGAPTSQQPLLPVSETIAIEDSIKESTNCNDLNKKNKDLENVLNLSGPIQPEISSASKSNANPSSEMGDFLINLLDLPHKSEDDNGGSNCAKDGNRDQVVLGSSQKEYANEELECKKKKPGQHDTGCMQFALTETAAVNKLLPADAMDDPKTGSYMLSEGKRLIKEVFRASVNLLFNDYNDGIQLEEHDLKLLRSAVNNITLILEDEKSFTRSDHFGGWPEAAWSPITNLKADGINQRKIPDSMRENVQFWGSSESENFVSRGGNVDHRKDDMMAQTFRNDIFKDVPGREEGSQSYKDLWLKCEAENCKLKCDLQETLMKLEFVNLEHQSKGKSALLTTSSSPKSRHEIDGRDTLLKNRGQMLKSLSHPLSDEGGRKDKNPSESLMPQQMYAPTSEDLEASVMARFKTLKNRKDQNNSWSMDEPEIVIGAVVAGPLADGENDAHMKDLGECLADLGFTESISGTHAIETHEALSSTAMPKPNSIHPRGAIYIEQLDQGIDASAITDSEEFLFNPGSLLRTKKQGQWYPVGPYRGSSSEWEDVCTY